MFIFNRPDLPFCLRLKRELAFEPRAGRDARRIQQFKLNGIRLFSKQNAAQSGAKTLTYLYRLISNCSSEIINFSNFTLTLLMMAMDSRERNLGYLTSSLTMLSNTSSSSSPGNGDSPTSISKMSTPRPHQSTARVYDVSVKTSGAKNSGVPQKVPVLSPKPMPSLQSPKSAILT